MANPLIPAVTAPDTVAPAAAGTVAVPAETLFTVMLKLTAAASVSMFAFKFVANEPAPVPVTLV